MAIAESLKAFKGKPDSMESLHTWEQALSAFPAETIRRAFEKCREKSAFLPAPASVASLCQTEIADSVPPPENGEGRMLRAVDWLFAHFKSIYGMKLARQWENADPETVKRTWAKALSGYKKEEILSALDRLCRRPWPPTLPEFLLLCRPEPDYEKAFRDAQHLIFLREEGTDNWPSKAVFWAAHAFGFFELRSASWAMAKERWIRLLNEKMAMPSLPDIPEKKLALVSPGKTAANTETAKAHLAKIKALLKTKRAPV